MKSTPAPTEDDNHDRNIWVQAAVEQHQAALLRYATRLLGDGDRARDIVQDAFVRLLAQPKAQVGV